MKPSPIFSFSSIAVLLLAGALGASLPTWPVQDEHEEVDLSMITSIDYEEGEPLPDEVTKLDGKKILIRGFMDPAQFTPEKLSEFRLVTDQCGCSGTPQLNHYVEVTLDGFDVEFQTGMVELEGTLSVGEVEEDGFVVSIYRLKATALR